MKKSSDAVSPTKFSGPFRVAAKLDTEQQPGNAPPVDETRQGTNFAKPESHRADGAQRPVPKQRKPRFVEETQH